MHKYILTTKKYESIFRDLKYMHVDTFNKQNLNKHVHCTIFIM